ncbi:hypothetical protein GW756_01650 [bacterium]|nr:hypothetical protein [bacterium]NCQ55059.1 hypothetical protein [Candidatus Parcubacteria bacterium]NCS67103.1 hypothetical protein [Candidatus Peregrinibacteria bacterium]NCS96049.1 hypothetical protein [bacterium]
MNKTKINTTDKSKYDSLKAAKYVILVHFLMNLAPFLAALFVIGKSGYNPTLGLSIISFVTLGYIVYGIKNNLNWIFLAFGIYAIVELKDLYTAILQQSEPFSEFVLSLILLIFLHWSIKELSKTKA